MKSKTESEVLNTLFKNKLQITPNALAQLLKEPKPLEKLNQTIPTSKLIITEADLKETKPQTKNKTQIKVIKNHTTNTPVREVADISNYFSSRYNQFKRQLQGRLKNTLSINHLKKISKEKVSVIAIVSGKRETKNGNILLEIEDPSGQTRAIATRKEALKKANEVVLDEVIGISGSAGEDILFIDDILWPDVPIHNKTKKLDDDCYIAFLSDTHVGSKKFMRKEFLDLIAWMQGNLGGEEQRKIAEKLKYVIIAGDLVDGIGVYPKQDKELETPDIYKQYEEVAKHLSEIPKHIKLIISPGNHDYLRTAQPQPPFNGGAAAPLSKLENAILVSNPALVNIHAHDNNGLNILIYHGTSIDTMVAADPNLKDGYKHPEKVMISLLKRRHLSPQYDTGLVAQNQDQMAINQIPDIFHAGHVHSNGATLYRGVTIVNSGAWQTQTEYQKLCGHEPTPGKLPIMNMRTRELIIIDFKTGAS